MPPKKTPEPLPIGSVDDILAADDQTLKIVDVPEWGCSVKVKAITLAEQDEIDEQCEGEDGNVDFKKQSTLMLVYGIAEPKFTLDQATALRAKNVHAVLRIVKAVNKINAADPGAIEAIEATFPSSGPE
jgi:hypothetical protein